MEEFVPFESILSNFQKTRQSNSLSVNNITSSQNQVFSIENLICNNIFQYLDLESLTKCSQENSHWLHESYKSPCIYRFDTIDMFQCEHSLFIDLIESDSDAMSHNHRRRYKARFKHLTRFKNAHVLSMNDIIYDDSNDFKNIYKQLQLFRKVKKMDIIFTRINISMKDRTEIIKQCILNNFDEMDSLSVNFGGITEPNQDCLSIFEGSKAVTFKKLTNLTLKRYPFNFKIGNTMDGYRLKHLSIVECLIPVTFWQYFE